ncbi:MAG: hypothetical protein IT378_21410, partial [Sandaracinaceae bacterium]|nr:hypothetical protein [Sandaracinaceae bacterium]
MSRKKKRKQTSKPRPAPSAASAPGAPELRAEPPPATARDERAPDRSALDGAQRVERDEAPASDVLGRRGEGTLLSRMGELGAAHDPAQTWTGILHLALVCAVLLIAGALPYLSHPLGLRLPRLEAWARGDGLPVARLFGPREEGAPVLAAAGQPSGSSVEQLGAAVAQSLAEDDAVLPVPGPAQRVEGRTPAVRIDPSELEDLAREIEDPEGRAMRPFYEALLRTARGDAGAITRVAHYGDSSIAGDGITSTLRRRLQQRFGDAGHGFVLIARGHMPYRHQDIEHEASDNWRLIELVRAGLSDHLYGYGGVQYRSAAGGTARFETSDGTPNGTAVSRFELWFQRHPRGGRVQLRFDGGEWEDLSTQGEGVEDAWHSVDVPDGPHRLDLRTAGGGENRLYGMTLDRTGRPGVAYDSLGMVGARARRML